MLHLVTTAGRGHTTLRVGIVTLCTGPDRRRRFGWSRPPRCLRAGLGLAREPPWHRCRRAGCSRLRQQVAEASTSPEPGLPADDTPVDAPAPRELPRCSPSPEGSVATLAVLLAPGARPLPEGSSEAARDSATQKDAHDRFLVFRGAPARLWRQAGCRGRVPHDRRAVVSLTTAEQERTRSGERDAGRRRALHIVCRWCCLSIPTTFDRGAGS